jgi:error-prone DNA polymerase
MTLSEHVVHDYAATSLSIKAHPVSFIRDQLESLQILPASGLAQAKNGDVVKVAGLILVRQRPETASGVCFITIEDETGCANLVVFQKLFDQYRKEILQSKLIMVEGKLQKEGEVIHVIVNSCYNFSKLLRHLIAYKAGDLPLTTLSRADERSEPVPVKKSPYENKINQINIFPEGRNFK